ncbi:MAG TPA: tetratricopeptide repeat protein [Terriglobales bacterium]|nr:tetratricopeptide repeat protein [Terriglobales bacterium]
MVACSLAASQQETSDAPAGTRTLIKEGKLDEAIVRLEDLARADSARPGLARELGVAYYRRGEHARAIPHLQQALKEDPGDREATQLLGLCYHFIGRMADAIPLLEKVRSWMPSANVNADYVLGLSYIQIKDFERARGAFASMYGVPPDSAAAHLFLARMLLRQEFDPVAEENALKAAELDPKLPGVHFLLGELYVFKSRIPEAIAEFERELALNPGHAATYYKLADAYTRIQKWDEAQRLLQNSIWLDSTASGPFVLLGKVLMKKDEHQLALRTLQRAVQMDPNNFVAHHWLGQAFRAVGKNEDAERELRLAQELQSQQNSGR